MRVSIMRVSNLRVLCYCAIALFFMLPVQAIINGGFATSPFLKGVVRVNDDCTGALVGNKCVLTAHHCLAKGRLGVVMFPEFKNSVVIETNRSSPITASWSPEYSEQRCYDMEIAQLKDYHNMGYNLTNITAGDSTGVAGWGFINDYTQPKELHFRQYTAKAEYSSEGVVIPVMDGVSGIAFRDSGGPLFTCIDTKCSVAAVANGKSKTSSFLNTKHVFCDVRSNWEWIAEILSSQCY
ncbi:hypothetical protein K7432_016043 [Basidiobolus ranarum]|uniref:Peptidase S1 domain-containing protein n=1 Tax=Basidiobolus ranarum TaxID=34480 RepID=A0ABR2WFA6_9FUNG